MGMFDSVLAPCPTCGKMLEFQSKAGNCNMKRYHHTTVPPAIAQDLSEYGQGYDVICCGKKFKLKTTIPRLHMTIKEITEEDDMDWDY